MQRQWVKKVTAHRPPPAQHPTRYTYPPQLFISLTLIESAIDAVCFVCSVAARPAVGGVANVNKTTLHVTCTVTSLFCTEQYITDDMLVS